MKKKRASDREEDQPRRGLKRPDFLPNLRERFRVATSPKGGQFLIMKLPTRRQAITVSVVIAALCLFALLATVAYRYFGPQNYRVSQADALLGTASDMLAKRISYDKKAGHYSFSYGTANSLEAKQSGASLVAATIPTDASKGVTVTDPTYKLDMTMTPHMALAEGKQDKNRIVYPLRGDKGWLVYTARGIGIKEDIVLAQPQGNELSFRYTLKLPEGTEARLEPDGSVGVYGNQMFMNNITAATDADAALLQKARVGARKTMLVFTIPKPIITELDTKTPQATAAFALDGNELTVTAKNLSKASYPLSIDPSIYIVTAQQFMNGNNETNIDFDVPDKLIRKSPTTGARFNSWNATTQLPQANWMGGTVAAGGYLYSAGGISQNGQVYTAQGAGSFVVPTGVTSLTVKLWGGGGGGGAGGRAAPGGAGGGGGYTTGTISVTPGETLDVYVGGGGNPGTRNTSGGGGGGGAFSSIYRDGSPLAIAAGGGGGGGGRSTASHTGGAGGAGGGASGIAGASAGGTGTANNGGGFGAASSGGAGGTGTNAGLAGSALIGGLGADGSTGATDGSGATGGLTGGGDGGGVTSTTRAAGGGGASGWFGGGGGGGSGTSRGGGGGGGGSGYGPGLTLTTGSGATPGNAGDSDRAGAGQGGSAGATANVGSAGANGIVIINYGTGGSSPTAALNWMQINANDNTLQSPNPGNGVCSGWCTDADYNLPQALSNFSMVAYNGFLYVIGGQNAAGTPQNTVYIAKLGANGEPQLWSPTSSDKSTWTYWYNDSSLSSARSGLTAVAYNNRMYLLGGRTSSAPVNTAEIADITPTGRLGGWTASTALPTTLHNHSSFAYNDRLYILGGNSSVSGTPLTTVYYTKINQNGSLNNWVPTTSFSGGRTSGGGSITTVWGAYAYISGGCGAVNASGYCTNILSDTQVASINADGSIDTWNTVGSVSDQRMGQNLLAWRNTIYQIGGCAAQNTSTGVCATPTAGTSFGVINKDGDTSTVGQSSPSGTSPCSGTTPTSCNLPGTTYLGNILTVSFISNGYLYVIGGCSSNTCSTTLGTIAYVAISSTGVLTKPTTCPAPRTTQGGMWCVSATNAITGGIAAGSPVVFNGRIYIVGGLTGSSNANTLLRADINQTDGSIGSWTSQPLASGGGNLGVNNVSYLYAFARANPNDATNNPGNLYIFGGCSASSAMGCTAYSQSVYKCNIQAAGPIANCSTSGQLQIGTIPGDTANGLGIMSGTVYANYVYLIGGVSPNLVDLKTVRYAKIDNNNNIVAVSGSSWIESPYQMEVGRRRSAAFGYNGYLYAVGGYEAVTGVLADIEFIKINVSDGSLVNGWVVSAVEINQRWGLSVPVSNSYAYVIGGCTNGASPTCNSGGPTDVIQTFQIYNNDSGTPAGYTNATSYTTNQQRLGGSATVLNGYLFMAGGCTGTTDCTTPVNTVSSAPIDANGNIGTWTNQATLPAATGWGKLGSTGGSLYYIGGQNAVGTSQATVYHATPSGGTISSWNTASNGLPSARSNFGFASWNNRLYVVGGAGTGSGCTGSNVCSTVYVSPQLNTGGNITSAWSTASSSLPVARSGTATVAYANNLYSFGGFDGTNYLSDASYSQLNAANGNAGNWNYTTSLPKSLTQADAVAANGYIYLVGGRSDATSCDPSTLIAPVSANTTIESGNNPTGVGEWSATNQRFTGARYGAAATYDDGKLYVLGGGCGATVSYPAAAATVQQTPLLSQPQVAKYSIMMDTDSDVFPSAWLINGLDNSIGARWQLKYRSMANQQTTTKCATMSTWGQETNFGNVTLGNPGAYIVKDGAGTNINCGRYFFFNVTVDSSQAFGYPDDVSRGPTITDLTLQFTADPAKRLMHGRTFIGGLQMPDDTPYYSN